MQCAFKHRGRVSFADGSVSLCDAKNIILLATQGDAEQIWCGERVVNTVEKGSFDKLKNKFFNLMEGPASTGVFVCALQV